MTALLSATDRRTKLGLLVLDVLVAEEIRLPSEVTRYPVEDGTVISDHVTQGAETVRIEGTMALADAAAIETSTAMSRATGYDLTSPDPGARMVDVVELLRRMHKERQVVSVSTGRMLYEEMAFEDLTAVRSTDRDGGNWLTVRAELTRLNKVTLRKAQVPEKPAQGAAAGRAGQTNKPAGRSSGTSTGSGNAAQAGKEAKEVTPLLGIFQRMGVMR